MQVGAGESLLLECETMGVPLPTLIWKVKGKPFQPLSSDTEAG